MNSSIVTLAIALCTNPGQYCYDNQTSRTCDPAILDKDCLNFVVEKSNSDKSAVKIKKGYDVCLSSHTHQYSQSSSTYRDHAKFDECLKKVKP